MATPVTSIAWNITFKRDSLVDQATYITTLATSAPKSTAVQLQREIEALGFVNVDLVLAVVLP